MVDDATFEKSKRNQRTQAAAITFVTKDPRFKVIDLHTRRRLIQLLPTGDWGIQTFDLVLMDDPDTTLTPANVEEHLDRLHLVEIKATLKPIRNAALNGFFFGATDRERQMALALPDLYRFLFVVLSAKNDYARPFAVLLTLEELDSYTRPWRIQYQVNFRTDLPAPSTESFLREGRLFM